MFSNFVVKMREQMPTAKDSSDILHKNRLIKESH